MLRVVCLLVLVVPWNGAGLIMWTGFEWCLVSDVVLKWLPAGWRGRESGVPLWIYMSRLGHTGASEDIVLRCTGMQVRG